MQIELSQEVGTALERAAAAAGMTFSDYASLLMKDQLAVDSQTARLRAEAVDDLIEHMKTASSESGRDGRRWREFIHEGHLK
jgi:hypothetical protein